MLSIHLIIYLFAFFNLFYIERWLGSAEVCITMQPAEQKVLQKYPMSAVELPNEKRNGR